MTITVASITATRAGAEISVCVRISNGENAEKQELTVFTSQFSELDIDKGEISEESFDALSDAAEVCSAVKRGMNILGYGACSQRNLTLKLRSKGFARETAESAAEYLASLGYINEESDALREAERCVKKLWGPRRIAAALYEKGYSEDAVIEALASLRNLDFSENCAILSAKKFGGYPEDECERRKAFASLTRYGYSPSQIKYALSCLEKNK